MKNCWRCSNKKLNLFYSLAIYCSGFASAVIFFIAGILAYLVWW